MTQKRYYRVEWFSPFSNFRIRTHPLVCFYELNSKRAKFAEHARLEFKMHIFYSWKIENVFRGKLCNIQHFLRLLRQVKKQNFKVRFWSWGPMTIWLNMTRVQFLSLKNHSTLVFCFVSSVKYYRSPN